MHEHFGANAGNDPDPELRAYRIDVLIDGVPEAAGVALMHEIADLLVEAGLGREEDGEEFHAVIALQPTDWSEHRKMAEALHVVIPTAVPRSPDLGLGYSPN